MTDVKQLPEAFLKEMEQLLLSPGTALEGARKGLLLRAYTVLPTLLPFMIGTGVIAAMGAVGLVVKPFSPLLSGVFHFLDFLS